MPLGLSGSCQDRETLFRDVFSFLITATGEGAGWETQTQRGRERVSFFRVRFSGSSVSGVASWQLSVVPVSLIQFAARWGRIKGRGRGT